MTSVTEEMIEALKRGNFTRARCPYASRYRALKPPKCGCSACAEKWLRALTSGETANG